MELSVQESEFVAQLQRIRSMKERETMHLDADGKIYFKRTADAEPIMQAMKDYGEILGNKRNDKVIGARLVGGIDPITATNWSKEMGGVGIGTAEFSKFAVNRIKNDIDFRGFRVGG